ncbi:YraN family protein [Clostridium sp. M14]|uniref:YraN family protein n=1 Tax=Clostridium sp. M14 TaxID=2716311 RepID=UPI0013EE567B|nr:YraN family protein [Clostridium sp. M14]MBZ9691079.1 YraN family protein [Clostridium sp. M14]
MKKFNKDIGTYCEKLSCYYLIENNFKILECNFKNFLGEIDIICIKNSILIIIEVKGRYNYEFGVPKESVSISKQKNIIKVTKSYINYKKLYNFNVRFDVIEVYLNKLNSSYKINHIKDAFRT